MSDLECLVLIVPAKRRDEVVDLLMAEAALSGFTRGAVAGFGREHSHFSLREAVQGFEDQERFEVIADGAAIETALEQLNAIAGTDRFFFWTYSIGRQGRLG